MQSIGNLRTQNELLTQEVFALRKRLDSDTSTVGSRGDNGLSSELRTFVNTLESDLLEERSKCSRVSSYYRRDVSQLRAALQTSHSVQRNLQRRLDQVMLELAVFKRGRHTPSSPARGQSPSLNGIRYCPKYSQSNPSSLTSSEADRQPARGRCQRRPFSAHNLYGSPQLGGTRRTVQRPASLSPSPLIGRISTASPPRLHAALRASRLPPRPASLDGMVNGRSVMRRFDPTAYIREKERQQDEISVRRRVDRRAQLSSVDNRLRARPCSGLGLEGCDLRGGSYSATPSEEFRTVAGHHPRQPSPRYLPSSSSCESLNRPSSVNLRRSALDPKLNRLLAGNRGIDDFRDGDDENVPQRVGRLTSRRSHRRSVSGQSSSDGGRVSCHRQVPNTLNDVTSLKRQASRLLRDDPDFSDYASEEYGPDLRRCRINRKPARTNSNNNNNCYRRSSGADDELDEIDHRLNVLQDFFAKYMTTS